VITDAKNQHDYEKKELKKIKGAHKKALHDLEAKKEQEIRVFRLLSAYLLDTLAEELHQRCCLEALVGEWADSSLDDESVDTYLALVAKRVAEVEAAQPKLKLVRPGGSTLSQRMQSLAEMNGSGHPTVAMQTHGNNDPL
jgi:nitrogen fixation/metabolism regulation signal transduction histidine kinase